MPRKPHLVKCECVFEKLDEGKTLPVEHRHGQVETIEMRIDIYGAVRRMPVGLTAGAPAAP